MNKFVLALSDTEILALTIYGEGRGEPIQGQVAIGSVIRNRRVTGNNFKSVCLAPKQFSCWNENDPNYPVLVEIAEQMINAQPIADIHFQQCYWVAAGIISYSVLDNTNGAKNYLTKSLFDSDRRPKWAETFKVSTQIGRQIFLVI